MKPAAASAFEAQRRHLHGLAYRMLGSHAEAEDIVQDDVLGAQCQVVHLLTVQQSTRVRGSFKHAFQGFQ